MRQELQRFDIGYLLWDKIHESTVPLANALCKASLQLGRNFPGHYLLRHAGFRVRKDVRDRSALSDKGALYAPSTSSFGSTGVTPASHNVTGHHIRYCREAVYVAIPGGSNAYDAFGRYGEDTPLGGFPSLGFVPAADPSRTTLCGRNKRPLRRGRCPWPCGGPSPRRSCARAPAG
ncbi:AbfB domain-containing protein [Microtetraspora malaysiensis]|uniref:AbfB domain-containing protein n=1 Tax=Microtetraspora malaysiensis TaxID=161358 RepID=UPI003D8E5186